MKRGAGILMPIFSIPSEERFGTLGKEAYEFVDFLHESGQIYWQVLPINEVDIYGSPFCSSCIYSGNPLFISLSGYLSKKDNELLKNKELSFESYRNIKMRLLFDVYKNGDFTSKINEFAASNSWVNEYSVFMVIYNEYEYLKDVPSSLKNINSIEYKEYVEKNAELINFYKFCQYLFFKQWKQLKEYCNYRGIYIIGDAPCNASMDSKEAFFDRKMYLLDENLTPSFVAGVPPDYFSSEGQVWNTLIYNYENIKADGYKYLLDKYKYLLSVYDYLKVDHFRGLEYFYRIPYGCSNGKVGEWMPGPGYEFIDLLRQNNINNLILEDLGIISDGVIALKEYSKYPGMKVFEFAFDGENSPFLVENHIENCVAYTGTHDNDTLYSFLSNNVNKEKVEKYLNLNKACSIQDVVCKSISKLYSSVANVVIINPQDLLMEGNDKRFNTPGTVLNNWMYCCNKKIYSKKIKEFLLNESLSSNRRG